MSNRTMLEFNHDMSPRYDDAELLRWAKQLRMYLGSGLMQQRHHAVLQPAQ